MSVRIICGDALTELAKLPADSIDSCVTDPPYGLKFMGKLWDHGIPGVPYWIEVLRVLKPGAHLLAFGGTRTHHRLMCAIEDAGFELRDTLGWLFGSGFPKSHNGPWGGTALKPAWEPIILARKPLIGTVAANVQSYGTGGLNIDGCRIATDGEVIHAPQSDPAKRGGVVGTDLGISNADVSDFQAAQRASVKRANTMGRWPANVITDGSDEVLECFPESAGQLADVSDTAPSAKTSNVYGAMARIGEPSKDDTNDGDVGFKMKPGARRLDTGSAARFFYCAKASREDRNDGLEGMRKTLLGTWGGEEDDLSEGTKLVFPRANHHPTVKPTDLMRYLCRLVTPKGGTVIDPFCGSGSTLKAAELEGFSAIGIDLEADYCEIARGRVGSDAPLFTETTA